MRLFFSLGGGKLGILIVILIIVAAYLFVKNLPIIALSIVGSIFILLVSNYVIKDMLHIDDKYIDTSRIEVLEDKVLLKNEEQLKEEKQKELDYFNSDFPNATPEYMECIENNLEILEDTSGENDKNLIDCNKKRTATDENVDTKYESNHDELTNIREDSATKDTVSPSDAEKLQYTYKFVDYSTEKDFKKLMEKHNDIIDKNFEKKLYSLNPYLKIEYDLGNAILAVGESADLFYIKYKK